MSRTLSTNRGASDSKNASERPGRNQNARHTQRTAVEETRAEPQPRTTSTALGSSAHGRPRFCVTIARRRSCRNEARSSRAGMRGDAFAALRLGSSQRHRDVGRAFVLQMKKILLSVCLSTAAVAQCNTWYVDPTTGSNLNPGTLSQPFLTLTYAAGVAASSAGIDTIVLLPGEYNDVNEAWPLNLPAGVSLQGTSALNTILINRDSSNRSVLRFEPPELDAYDGTVVDGVTIVGRRRCVEITDALVTLETEEFRVRSNPTFANCFLLDSEVAAVDISVQPGNIYLPHDADNNGLVENRPKFINCTIVTSIIGVLNRIEVTPGEESWGESEPGLLNVLLSDNSFSDLEGIDSLDVITCAFATADAAGVSPIKAGRVLPTPVFNTTTNPPLYVDAAGLGIALTPIDIRVLPTSPAIDTGSQPALAWGNGTTGQQTFMCTIDIWDTDCECYGNPRVEREAIDIGADESGVQIVAGYQRGTTILNNGGNSPFPGQIRIWLNPFPAFPANNYVGNFAINSWSIAALFWQLWAPTTIQNVRSFLSSPATPVAGLGTLWMLVTPQTVTFPLNFVNPVTPVNLSVPLGGPRVQFNMQALPTQGALTRNLSNLQTFFAP